jgi:hypothetical protein
MFKEDNYMNKIMKHIVNFLLIESMSCVRYRMSIRFLKT